MATKRPAARKAAPKKKKAYTHDSLIALAEDLNESLGLEPPIDIELEEGDLKVEIEVNCHEEDEVAIYTTDELSDDSLVTLEAIGILPVEAPEEPEEDPGPKKKAPAKKAPAKKAPPKKKAPVEEEEPDGEEPEEEEQEEEEEPAPKKKAPAKKAPAKKKESKPRYSRADAFGQAVAEGVEDLEDLADRADEIYCAAVEREDASNLRESKWIQGHGIKILTALGIGEVVKGKFVLSIELPE